jgi:AAA domain-containing protein
MLNRTLLTDDESAALDASIALNLVDLRHIRIEPVTWLLLDRLPLGEVTIIDGKGGIGKTTVMLDLAARLSCGRDMPDGTPTQPAMVLVIAEEDRQMIVKARLLAGDADLARVRLVASVGDDDAFFVLPNHAGALRETIRTTCAQFVIIDSLFSHFDDDIDAHRAQDARRALLPLIEIAHDTGAAIVGIRHWTKAAAAASDRGLGSADIRNVVRSVLTVGEHPDDEGRYVVAVSKSNLGRPCDALTYRLNSVSVEEDSKSVDVARVAWGESVTLNADDLANRVAAEDLSDRTAVDDWLQGYITGPTPTQDVLSAGRREGLSRSSLYRAAKRLRVEQHRSGFGGPSTWAPPAAAPSVSQSSHTSHVPDGETTETTGDS